MKSKGRGNMKRVLPVILIMFVVFSAFMLKQVTKNKKNRLAVNTSPSLTQPTTQPAPPPPVIPQTNQTLSSNNTGNRVLTSNNTVVSKISDNRSKEGEKVLDERKEKQVQDSKKDDLESIFKEFGKRKRVEGFSENKNSFSQNEFSLPPPPPLSSTVPNPNLTPPTSQPSSSEPLVGIRIYGVVKKNGEYKLMTDKGVLGEGEVIPGSNEKIEKIFMDRVKTSKRIIYF